MKFQMTVMTLVNIRFRCITLTKNVVVEIVLFMFVLTTNIYGKYYSNTSLAAIGLQIREAIQA